ncbi:hypothetical protein KEM60_00063 [Austwickia sp. TVS 96-490-7B]|uniref:DNA/RNA non-specific endonuclease n=1 Tax=Austwickia sp. TVS 96-490-7B TaxID=2830843 RepID=UPI001C566800|nr:DNA/RNA non-specific endonuclease [Austwickia sp. TVS 96-490-7B]MBW3083884.1 hypothetical protein [Austwickia sp. TVS 96-490-7B]
MGIFTSPVREVHHGAYRHAGECLDAGATTLKNALVQTVIGLRACQGMAGTFPVGEDWAKAYDATARDLIMGTHNAAAMTAGLAALAKATEAIHENADLASHPTSDVQQNLPELPGVTQCVALPPSAFGGGTAPPAWWEVASRWLSGVVWPNADTAKLRAAATLWRQLADSYLQVQTEFNKSITHIKSNTSPEVEPAVKSLTDTTGDMTELAASCREVASSCDDFAQAIEKAHEALIAAGVQFLIETAAIEAIGALAGMFTLGIAELAAQGVEGARLAAVLDKIVLIILALERVGQLVRTRLAAAATKIGAPVISLSQRVANLRIVPPDFRNVYVGIPLFGVQRNIVRATFGVKGAWNADLRHIKPFTRYEVNGGQFIYETGVNGRIVKAKATLSKIVKNGPRDPAAQLRAGGAYRKPHDDGGHIFGRQFGGGAEDINYLAMKDSVNRINPREYGKLEDIWRKAIKGPPPQQVEVDVTPHYNNPLSTRPDMISVRYKIGNGKFISSTINNS